MSWSNPTPDEAAESYSYYKSKYSKAASQNQDNEKKEQSYSDQKNSATSQMNTLSSKKFQLEQRLDGIANIIRMLEGGAPSVSKNVPHAISNVSSALKKADISYKSSIRMSGGVAAASLESAFATRTVEGDSRSGSALRQFKAEKTRIEQEIADLKAQIASLSSLISSLKSQINSCIAAQTSLQSAMKSYAYEMNHYKKYMF